MRTEEDEAFDDLAKKQGDWGGGFPAKRKAAADKLQEPVAYPKGDVVGPCICGSWPGGTCLKCPLIAAQPTHCQCTACKDGILHASDCAVHNGPAYPAGECDCGVAQEPYDQTALELCNVCGWKTLIPDDGCLNCERAQPAQEPVVRVLQIIKELRPAIKPMEGMGKGKTTDEWFDILVKEIERIQPAQEPVAWMSEENDCIFFDADKPNPMDYEFWTPLYTAPPQRPWVGLTYDEVFEAMAESMNSDVLNQKVYEAIEAKLKEKNNGN